MNDLTNAESSIKDWLDRNIYKDRDDRAKNLWIYGATRMGKSYLLKQLSEMLNIYWFPQTENFFNGFHNEYDLIAMDEYTGNHAITVMNAWCCGTPMNIPTKGGQMIKTRHIPVIVTSNQRPEDFYQHVKMKHPETFEAFLDRFVVVNVRQQLNFLFN